MVKRNCYYHYWWNIYELSFGFI